MSKETERRGQSFKVFPRVLWENCFCVREERVFLCMSERECPCPLRKRQQPAGEMMNRWGTHVAGEEAENLMERKILG